MDSRAFDRDIDDQNLPSDRTNYASSRERANGLRVLSLDTMQTAGSGYTAIPLEMADIAEVLWNDYLRHNPQNPDWVDRDRLVLSNVHGSPLLYCLLHLSGYDLTVEDLKSFRQPQSKTPAFPEYGITPGVQISTEAVGQGLANAAGLALAERLLATRFNRDGFTVVDHFTYVLLGNGCLMEGISHEAGSLAGTLGLGKLIGIYADNSVAPTDSWLTEDVPTRFEAYGWQVLRNVDGHDAAAVRQAIAAAQADTNRPSLICCKTPIGQWTSNRAPQPESLEAPLSEIEAATARKNLGGNHPPFQIPQHHYVAWDARENGARLESEWKARVVAYGQTFPELASEFERRMAGELPRQWAETAQAFIHEELARQKPMATRHCSQAALNRFAPILPELIGGSADLTPANMTTWKDSVAVCRGQGGNYVHYGAREEVMGAMINGIALHGGFIPFGGTFLMFCDYGRYTLRMAAADRARSIFVYTHDSIGLGEDGPTHQPVEQLASLRLIPGMALWRPCDAVESAVAWRMAIEKRDGPTCLVFTRQKIPCPLRDPGTEENIWRGGYVLCDSPGEPEAIIIATGSEVPLVTQAASLLTDRGRRIRIVSMPCIEAFEAQDTAYRQSVLPPHVTARVVVEAGVTDLWRKYAGPWGRVIGLDRFGESAPQEVLFEYFGFNVENVVQTVETVLKSR